MSTFTWQLPSPPVAPSPSPGGSPATPPNADNTTSFGLLDLALDPGTRDLVDMPNGDPLEVADSRNAVMFQIACRYNAWWRDSKVGSRVTAILASPTPAEILDVVDALKEGLQVLVDDGEISDLSVISDVDQNQLPVVAIYYRNTSTGTPIDLVYNPSH